MDHFLQDLRHAARRLRSAPGFSLVAILTLALGIGANTAIFGVVDAVLLRALPFADQERVVVLSSATPEGEGPISGPDFLDYVEQNRTFESLAVGRETELTLEGSGDPERVDAALVSANFFGVVGAAPVLGRAFRGGEDAVDAPRVALLGNGLWTRRFGADPGIVGRTARIEGREVEVVGVMPAGFDFPGEADLWMPQRQVPELFGQDARGNHSLQAWGRLRPGVTVEQAAADLGAIARRLEAEYPETNTDFGVAATPIAERLTGEARPALLVLLAAVGVVLLIACANLANLLLARAAGRKGEISVRLALGARRSRLVGQLLVESVLLALLGGGAGLLLAVWALDLLRAFGPEQVPRLDEVAIDGRVLLFTLGLSIATALLFGLIPALHATRAELGETLREAGRSGRAATRGRTRSVLIVAETALAVVLLIGAGLLLKSFARLQQVDPGFRAENVLAVDVPLPATSYPSGSAAATDAYARLLERVRALPGVEAAGGALMLPLSGMNMTTSMIDQARAAPEPGQVPTAQVRLVTPGYVEALGVRLVRGRLLGEQDRGGRAVLISEEAARRYYPDEDPIGRTVELGMDWGNGPMGGVIVGVVGGVRHSRLDRDHAPEAYVPFDQAGANEMTLVVRTAGDPTALAAAVRREVRETDRAIPIGEVRTLESLVSRAVAQPRFYTLLLGFFGAIAVVLAGVGIYGVVTHAVARRTQEFGIRMALGADGGRLVRMVLGQYMRLTFLGVALGLVAAFGLSRLLAGLLYGVGATDPATFVAVPVLLGTVAALASVVPARHATRIAPSEALRRE